MNKTWKFILLTTLILSSLVGCDPSSGESTEKPNPIDLQQSSEIPPSLTPTESQSEPTVNYALDHSEIVFIDKSVEKIPLIYSHGGGPCDIGGMAYFSKHPNVDLIGLVLSRGEFYPEIAVNYWPIYLYDVLDSKNTALGLGSDIRMHPNSSDFPESWRPASSKFWNLPLPDKVTEYQPAIGHELIIELVNNSPEKVTILAMASMVDIALALQEDPGIIENISHVVIMGGAFTVPGNLSDAPYEIDNEVAEWNMWIDAEAARVLFNSGVPMSIVPLDGIQYLVNNDDIGQIMTIDDPGVNYVTQMWNQQIGWGGPFLIWDTITATAVTNPENFYWTYDGVDVVTEPGKLLGQTIPLNNGAYHMRYATGADYEAIMDLLFEVYQGDITVWEPAVADTSAQRNDALVENLEKTISVLGGTWEGDTGGFQILFSFDSECKLNQICGSFEIPDFPLTGDITFVNINGDVYEFVATNLSAEVEQAEYEYLEIREDGKINYVSIGSTGSSNAILEKK